MMEVVLISAISVYGLGSSISKIYETFTLKNFSWFRASIKKKNKKVYYLLMPIFLCRVCMSSAWGSVFYAYWKWEILSELFFGVDNFVSIFAIAGVVYFMTELERRAL